MQYNVLVVEDNCEIHSIVSKYLIREGYSCTVVEDGFEALETFRCDEFHLVLLDIMLPGIDGFEILRRIRESSQVPVIMLTARQLETDRIKGFDVGADDYVVKPFSTRELMRRVKVLLKRVYRDTDDGILHYGDLVLDTKKMLLSSEEEIIDLTTTEFRLLEVFMRHVGVVLSREQIIEMANGPHYEAYNRNIDTYVKKLRKKLGSREYIKTKYGAGYRFGEQ